MYKQLDGTNSVVRLSDNAVINPSESQDWKDYIEWLDQGNIPLLAKSIDQLRQQTIEALDTCCELTIIGGFESDALGEVHRYDSQIEDQINLIGVMLAAQSTGTPIDYKCTNVDTNVRGWFSHTPQQISKVYMDGLIFKSQQLRKLSTLKDMINQATSIEEIENIRWD